MESQDITKQKAESLLKEHFGEDSVFVNYESKILRLNRLLEVAKIVNSSLKKEPLLESILYSCQGQFFVANASIFLYDELESVYVLEANTGLGYDPINIVLKEADPLIEYLKENIDLVDIKKHLDKSQYPNFHECNQVLKGEWILPLKVKKKLNGFLILGSKANQEELTYEDLYYLTTFAEIASIAIENMVLFQLVVMDRMTKLYDHHSFINHLNHELSRAKRYNRDLSVILLDIDHFKNLNDTYGHQEGDIILVGLAALLKDITRKADIVARYGGEEFAIILTESDSKKASQAADKIRTTIEQYKFASNNKKDYKLTVSLGVATYREKDKLTAKELIELADKALYESKNRGRNCITTDLEMSQS